MNIVGKKTIEKTAVIENGSTKAYLVKDPLGNTDLFIFSYAGAFFGRQTIKEEVIQFAKNLGKPLMLIDIKDSYINYVKKHFPEDIILNQPYTSSNGSHMCIIIINLTKYLQ